MIRLLFIVASVLLISCSGTSKISDSELDGVKLIDWSMGECEGGDAYRLVNRISSLYVSGDTTYLSVNFADNCRVEPNPAIRFTNDTLFIQPYQDEMTTLCDCNCCFTLNLSIIGITEREYTTVFDEEVIMLSSAKYPTEPIKYEIYKGDTINKNNRYGARIGQWYEFYEDSVLHREIYYTVQEEFHESKTELFVVYNEKGKMIHYEEGDSTVRWHMNGQLSSRRYTKHLENGDRVKILRSYYNNGQLREYETQIYYHKDNRVNGLIARTENHEKYFKDESREFMRWEDSTKTWFEDGSLKELTLKDSSVEWNNNGIIVKTNSRWKTEGCIKGCSHSLTLYYNDQGDLVEKRFVSDESVKNGYSSHYYTWKWNENGDLIEEPEELPDIEGLRSNRIID